MLHSVLGKYNIEIPVELVSFFENNFDKLTSNKLSYIAVAMDVTDNDSIDEIQEKIIRGMIEEMCLQVDVAPIQTFLRNEGYTI